MFRRLSKQKIGALLIALPMILNGCQAVGGLDVNKAIFEASTAQSLEGKSTIIFDLVPGDQAQARASSKEQTVMKLLEHIEIHHDAIKMDSAQNVSSTGYITIANHKIAFQTYMTKEQVIIALEGGKKPIVIDLTSSSTGDLPPVLVKQMEERFEPFVNSLSSFLIKQLPNPGKLNVDNVREVVNGETLSLNKIHGEISGKELIPLAKTFVTNLMQDDKALKQLIGELYDLLYPILSPQLDQWIQDNKDGKALQNPLEGYPIPETPGSKAGVDSLIGMLDILKNRDMTIEVIHTEIKQLSVFVLLGLHARKEQELQEELPFLNDSTRVKADLYVDNTMKLRKSNLEIEATSLNAVSRGSLSSAKISIAGEYWNLNNPVKLVPLTADEDALVLEKGITAVDVLRNFTPSSEAYRLLKDDLGISKKTVLLLMDGDRYKANSRKPFLEDGVAMVPTTFLSEKLDLRVDWNEEAQTVTIIDPVNLTTIKLNSGSQTALVNGEEIQMDKEMLQRDGIHFVPLTFIVTQLGGQTEWYNEARSIQITR
ncbi:copper amine oxidase N-terminal domain-containing protein [Paenibacillus sp. WQ 127069]|uniref:Copper amine oxidase N-terminal domain-containing protein n=1 Tax=Paenibacillus baimaensis TaxID=2982185 RepID=A0ABT2UEQ9_9BACL|nr:copper amine oxidase N-terminal domain-containing protein [Paenibacillus sp. WQ 127069]MCU6792129.1 copper amine oxidase N-terminal domain-containing protein [Paenibacillus sp. WQ 127069]